MTTCPLCGQLITDPNDLAGRETMLICRWCWWLEYGEIVIVLDRLEAERAEQEKPA